MASNSFFSLWPILPFGAEENNEQQQQQNEQQQQNNQGGQQNSGGQQNNQQQQNDEDDPYAGMSAKELKRALADAEKGKASTASELKTFRDAQEAEQRKKNDDVTNLTKDVADRDDTIATLRATMTKQAITSAIRDDSRFEWHNVNIVAQQLNPDIVKVSDDGKVEGVAKELTRISKDDSLKMLLKKDNTQQQNQNQNQQQNGTNNQEQQQNNGSTGFQPGQGGANGGGSLPPNAKELAEKIPALRGRI